MSQDIQARVDRALTDPQTGQPWQRFSPYLTSVEIPLQERLEAAAVGGLHGMMDEFERLMECTDPESDEPHRLRLALMTVLRYHPLALEAGIKLP